MTLTPISRNSIRTWLLSRQPSPPAPLRECLVSSLDAAPDSIFHGESVATVAGALGTWMLDRLARRQAVDADAALQLLAADAFVTYAFEAAAEEGREVAALAERLLAEVRWC